MYHKLCHFIWCIWWFHRSKDFEAMKAGKSAIRPWLSCPYNEHTLMDLPSSVGQPKFWTQRNPITLSENVKILPWCGRQNTRRIAEARARLIQRPKRQGHKLAKVASHVWTMFAGLLSCIRSPKFFGYEKKEKKNVNLAFKTSSE